MKQEAAVPAAATLSKSYSFTQLSTEKLSGHLFDLLGCGPQVFFLLTQDGNLFMRQNGLRGGEVLSLQGVSYLFSFLWPMEVM